MSRAPRPWSAAIVALALALPVAATAADAAAAPAVPIAGSAAAGKALFTGAVPMRNGGAACGACHAVGGHGAALAASLGPDLSHSFEGLPAEAIDGMLQDLPFPTMAPIYAGHGLTPEERANLAAFLVTGAGAEPPGARAVLPPAGAIAAVLVLLLAIGATRRKGSTRAGLVAHPPAPERPPLTPRPFHTPADASAGTPTARSGGTR